MPPCPGRIGGPTGWRAAVRRRRRGCPRSAATRSVSSSALAGPRPRHARTRRLGHRSGRGHRGDGSPPFLGLLVGIEDAQRDHLRQLVGVLVVLDTVPRRQGLWRRCRSGSLGGGNGPGSPCYPAVLLGWLVPAGAAFGLVQQRVSGLG